MDDNAVLHSQFQDTNGIEIRVATDLACEVGFRIAVIKAKGRKPSRWSSIIVFCSSAMQPIAISLFAEPKHP
jgi:hypothetical protein